jgi:glycosyltransferase involved in cell wall biosynthesis
MRRQVEVLSARHEVTFVEVPEPSGPHSSLSFASEDHRRSAAVLAAIERAYERQAPPHYLEFCDYRALGLVPLQARAAGHQLLRGSRIGIRASSPAELLALYDGRSSLPGEERVAELEREQFRLADWLLWPGGDVLDRYRRHYADTRLPRAVLMKRPFPVPEKPPALPPVAPDGPLRILYAGRLQRLKGVLDLVEACLQLEDDNWELTLIGADTPTAPVGQSVRMTVEVMCGDDPRVRIEDVISREDLQARFSDHDLLVIPSSFEVCANVAIEAMRAGLPVLSTPVGGQVELIDPGVSGWLADGTGPAPLARALSKLLADREAVAAVRTSGKVFESFRRGTDPEAVLDAYEDLFQERSTAAAVEPRAAGSHVTAVVPYYRAHLYVEEAVASLLGQTYVDLDVILVNDGSFDPEDRILEELAKDPRVTLVHQLNRGDASARNLGIALAGGEYLMMFDADNVLEPEFVERALQMFMLDPELAYVTCWLRFVDPDGEDLRGQGYAPLGNRVVREEGENWDGDMTALVSRRALEQLGSAYDPRIAIQADWDLYRRLRDRREYGAVIPELLAKYRVQPNSILRMHDESIHRRGWVEAQGWRRLQAASQRVGHG